MSYVCNLVHFIWSTARRERMIREEWEGRMFSYMGGILEKKKGKLLCANGVEDHVHLLVSLPGTMSLADCAGVVKANSSRFVHEELGERGFDWQKGYAGFSVSVAGEGAVRRYIGKQKAHHAEKTFKEELVAFLERHGVAYDPRYVFE